MHTHRHTHTHAHTHRLEQSTSIPTTQYEFPNGYNLNLTVEKFKLCEGLFDASSQNLRGVSGGDLLSIPNVAINSASLCDVDIRTVSPWISLYCTILNMGILIPLNNST